MGASPPLRPRPKNEKRGVPPPPWVHGQRLEHVRHGTGYVCVCVWHRQSVLSDPMGETSECSLPPGSDGEGGHACPYSQGETCAAVPHAGRGVVGVGGGGDMNSFMSRWPTLILAQAHTSARQAQASHRGWADCGFMPVCLGQAGLPGKAVCSAYCHYSTHVHDTVRVSADVPFTWCRRTLLQEVSC